MNTLKAETRNMSLKAKALRKEGFVTGCIFWCCIIKVDTLFSRILIYNHNQYENRRKTYGTESKNLMTMNLKHRR